MAGSSQNEAVASPLHPHLLLLAQPGRGGGSNSSPTGGSAEEPSPVSMLSSRPLQCEPSARTTTPNPSHGTRPPTTPSPRSTEAKPPSPTKPNPRHTTRYGCRYRRLHRDSSMRRMKAIPVPIEIPSPGNAAPKLSPASVTAHQTAIGAPFNSSLTARLPSMRLNGYALVPHAHHPFQCRETLVELGADELAERRLPARVADVAVGPIVRRRAVHVRRVRRW